MPPTDAAAALRSLPLVMPMVLATALASAQPATAQPAADVVTPAVPWLEAAVVHLPYTASERLGAVELNRERGSMTGARLRLGVVARVGTLSLDVEQLHGDLGYRGYTQFGMPLQTQTRLRMDRFGLTLAPAWPAALALADGALTPQLGLQQRWLDRRIAATAVTTPLNERLRLDLLDLGLRWQRSLPAGSRLNLGLHWLQPVGTALRVDTGGVVDTHTLRPSHRGWPAAELVLHRTLAAGLSASVGLRLEQPQIGSAPARAITRQGLPAGVSSYPGSQQRWHSLALALNWQP